MVAGQQVDVVVRFHASARLLELERCLFSLVGQHHRPLHIILVLQRFSPEEIAATRRVIEPLLQGHDAPTLSVANFADAEPVDARASLLNRGLSLATGRYVAFLDYDDVLYPEAFELMTAKLRQSEAAIAFASVRLVRVAPYDRFIFAKQELPQFAGANLADLFRSNFCPIHSYLIDRHQIDPAILSFKPDMDLEEDYEFLLRICAECPADFSLVGTKIGEYLHKTDGSNTVAMASGMDDARVQYYNRVVIPTIERCRQTHRLSRPVLLSLGLDPDGPLTIRETLTLLKPDRA